MHSTTRRSRIQALAATAMLLAAPAAGFAADEVDWGFRASFRSYVHGGTGTPPISASAGATCDPNPNVVKGGCDPKPGVTTPAGVFGWAATTYSYDLPDGDGVIESAGTVLFDRPDHFFNLSIVDPIITVAADGTAVVNARMKLIVTMGTTPPVDQRMNLGEFDLASDPVVTATTVTWNLVNGAITSEAATALAGYLTAGDPLDDMRIILPFVEPPSGTPITSTNILLKDDPAKPDKRGLTVVVSKEPGVVPANIDPTVDGATVRVVSSTFDDTYVLPASNWTAVLKKGVVAGYKYADSKRLLGPISAAQITVAGLKITGKGEGLSHTLGTEPAGVSVVVSSGDDSLCAGVGAASKKTYKAGKLFKGTKNAAPASCPDAPLPG
jgi:hypothetical protein